MLTLWNAFDDRFINDVRRAAAVPSRARFEPAVDVLEHEGAYELKVELPGVKPEEIEVSLDRNTLSISGERRHANEQRQNEGYYRLERRYGEFRRSFTLPENVDASAISAELVQGLLTLKLPKKERPTPRKISVTGGSLSNEAPKSPNPL